MTTYTVNYADAGFSAVQIPAETVDALKARIVSLFPDAANAEVSVEGTNVTFSVRKGSKA